MGPTSAGKTTIGRLFVDHIRKAGMPAIHFDGNEVRDFFGSSLGFQPEDRLRAVSTCAYLANKSAEAGLNVVVSALTANEDARQFVRKNVRNLVLSYLKCPMEVCFERDARGLYRMAREKKIEPDTVIGLDSPYVPPSDPDIVLETAVLSPDESVKRLMNWLKKAGYNLP
jgi:adenylylsulfate kinase